MYQKKQNTFYNTINNLKKYWLKEGCTILQPLDLSVGAGTFHYHTFLKTIGPEPTSIAYIQPSRRPLDSRFGNNPNRLQHYYQFQVIIKPAPNNIQELYLNSLKILNIDNKNNDIRFVEDNWENPTLGAWGIGWEIWLNGMETSQFTYFQQMGGLECNPVTAEITYGLERLVMHLQNKKNVYSIIWHQNKLNKTTYGDLFLENEKEQSEYNFKVANIKFLLKIFNQYLDEANRILSDKYNLLLPAYECILHSNHIFNILDSRKAISTTERQNYILKIRKTTKKIAEKYYLRRKNLGFPLCKKKGILYEK
ncbi:Glycine--tRNA ligase alpha subunit [Buchnera aphidicola (Eriosoma grossulariae)]|uniref:glycine--tRNA ligase subunit alpha n=1 Tax=Buchnera aphidicola TaxID=9 RepID=UPI003464DEA3